MKKIIKIIKKPKKLLIYILSKNFFAFIPDKLYLKLKYKLCIGKKLNLDNPTSFNEKLQWLKLYNRCPQYPNLVDKYSVRTYVANVIGCCYLIPIIGIWDKFEDIDFNALPQQFVLKPNHTSGNVFICKDKNNINYDSLNREVKKWLKRKYYWIHREWPYKHIKPRIICEKLIEDKSSNDLKDYKFMCFDGEVKCCFVCSNRNDKDGLKVDFYDLNWNRMPFIRHYPNSVCNIPKPKCYEEMIRLANQLSIGIPFVRVDFYEVNGKVYFGELTFFPGAGFEEFTPESYDYLLGSWIKLPNIID